MAELNDDELRELLRLAKSVLWGDPSVRRRLQDAGVNITPANFYSDIPLQADLDRTFERREGRALPVYDHGLFDASSMEAFIDQIAPYAHEFDPPREQDGAAGFFWKNPAFSYADAMAYYCILRHFKPERVLEIGSGYSTLVADAALKKNGSGALTLIEPYPKEFLRSIETVDEIIESFVQDIPVDDVVRLVERSAVWFIDSTHTVKIGSDCLYIYLLVMPRVKTNVLVHTHDVHLPFGMPVKKAAERHVYWTEQYLLYAYMLDNPKIEVLFGSEYAFRMLEEPTARLMAGRYPGGGGSIWYRLDGTQARP